MMRFRLLNLGLRLSLMVVALTSCSMMEGRTGGPNYGLTLADLQSVNMPEEAYPVPLTSIDKIEESYRSALDVAKDPDVRHRILTRLGDLEMARSEQRQLTLQEQDKHFSGAIDMYKELLVLNAQRQHEPGTPTNERLLYQLSKAYALDGRMAESDATLAQLVKQFPLSPFVAEADFRRAEKAFSDAEYAQAEALYGKVAAVGDDTPFYERSVYMHGWSQFKRGKYRESIRSFTEVLDRNLIQGKSLDELTNTQRNITQDTLRVLSLAFSYLNGAETITEVYSSLGLRHYQHRLYMRLGDLYLEKRRFRDSADTYRHYVRYFPNTDPAPGFSIKAIEVYGLGGFPSLILPAKEEYVRSYGIRSQFWQDRDDSRRAGIKPTLKLYLDELSSFYHARALNLKKLNQKYAQSRAAGRRPKDKPESPVNDFLTAATLYEEYIATFPKDAKTAEMAYLMGESLFEADDLPRAVRAYETVAYTYLDPKRGAEAGYSAVVALQALVDRAKDSPSKINEYTTWRDHKIESAISFADYYPMDQRAAPTLTKAAQEIFEKGEFQRAADIAMRITTWTPPQSFELRKTAWLIVAHSRFDLNQYAEAEVAYQQLLDMLPATDPDRIKLTERLAASVYRQAEQQIAAGELGLAVDRLLSLNKIAPGSDVAISGQYDAANYLMELKDWPAAEKVLLDFQRLYPTHRLAKTLAPKFAFIYQEMGQWGKAASALESMAANNPSADARRQSMYLSAELYEKSGNLAKAIDLYRNYVTTFPLPFDFATEARYHLVELYGKTKDTSKRNFWLAALVREDAKAGKNRTERSTYLAAYGAAELAEDEFVRYEKIKLTLPLNKSLKAKRGALDATLESYRKVLNYGVAEFATRANHRIGDIYFQLSKDLMASERPNGLDELALEQYEILLEEQALPFEEKAIEILASNAERSWKGIYDKWVKESFAALAKILPARYGKKETSVEFSDAIF